MDSIELDDVESHHIRNVLRMTAGDTVELFDGQGSTAEASIEKTNRRTIRARVLRRTQHPPRQSGRIVLAVSMAKGQRFEALIEQGTELGVDHFVPVVFQRTVKQAAGDSSGPRFHKIAVAAAKQCGRVFLPKIDSVSRFEEVLGRLRIEYPTANCIFGGFSAEAIPLLRGGLEAGDTIAWIGPEGGFNDEEQRILRDTGAKEIVLCQTTLRIETAGIALASILCAGRDSR